MISKLYRWMCLACVLLLQPVCFAETVDELFTRATRLNETDLTQSRELFRLAALRFAAEAEAKPEQTGPLLYNAGNAYFLSGDLGRAIVAYRKAAKEIPASPLLRANLAYVRKQAGNIDEPTHGSLLSLIRFWSWPAPVLWILIALSLSVFWAVRFTQLWLEWKPPVLVSGLSLGLALVLLASIAVTTYHERQQCRAVIIAPQVEARKGPSYGYEPAFTAALNAGLECTVLRHEGTWIYIRLAQNHTAWIPRETVEVWQGTLPAEG